MKNCIGLPPDILCKLSFHKRVLLKLSAFLLIITLTLPLNRSTLVMCIMFKGKYLLIAVLALYQGVLLRFWLVDLKEKPSLFKSHIKVYHTKTYRDICYSQYRLMMTRRCYIYMYVFEVESSKMLLSDLKRVDILLVMQWICCVLPKSVMRKKNGHDK